MQDLITTLTSAAKEIPESKQLGFGKYFSDHMFKLNFSEGLGWHRPRITPYSSIAIDPAATVLHYGQALFEGMKCFRQTSGKLVLFRPDWNAKRLQEGAERLCMQAPPANLMIEGIKELIRVDQK